MGERRVGIPIRLLPATPSSGTTRFLISLIIPYYLINTHSAIQPLLLNAWRFTTNVHLV